MAPTRPVKVPRTGSVVKELLPVKLLLPVKVLLLARSVEDAAVIVMSPVPLKETPLMRRPAWSAVAVPALPLTEPVIVEEKVLEPLKVLLSERSVEEAATPDPEDVAIKASPPVVLDQPRT